MASVRGVDPRLVAGSGPGCVTTNRDRDTTYVGTGPDQLPLAKRWKEKRPILQGKIERDSHTPKNTSKPKKRGPNCFCFCFCSTPLFLMVKGIKLKENQRERKIYPDPAIIGRVQREQRPRHLYLERAARPEAGCRPPESWRTKSKRRRRKRSRKRRWRSQKRRWKKMKRRKRKKKRTEEEDYEEREEGEGERLFSLLARFLGGLCSHPLLSLLLGYSRGRGVAGHSRGRGGAGHRRVRRLQNLLRNLQLLTIRTALGRGSLSGLEAARRRGLTEAAAPSCVRPLPACPRLSSSSGFRHRLAHAEVLRPGRS
jgi:hypothetical protein